MEPPNIRPISAIEPVSPAFPQPSIFRLKSGFSFFPFTFPPLPLRPENYPSSYTTIMANVGKVKQIIGAVVDVQFNGNLPEIYNALELKKENGETLVLEVQ